MQNPAPSRHVLFLVGSTREPGHMGNTEWLARQAALALPPDVRQTWITPAQLALPPFTDLRHTAGSYPPPEGALKEVFEATMAATDIVLVSPVYWFSIPSPLKTMLDHWSAWLRVPGAGFKEAMQAKTLRVIATSGDRGKAQPMIDSYRLCAAFFPMAWGGALWGKGGPPDAVRADAAAVEAAREFLLQPGAG